LQICKKQTLQLYSDWTEFQADLRVMTSQLQGALHVLLDAVSSSNSGSALALIPSPISCAAEAALPLPEGEAADYASEATLDARMETEAQLSKQWALQCPPAAGQIIAAMIMILEDRMCSPPGIQASEEAGEGVTNNSSGVLASRSYRTLAELLHSS